MPSQIFRHPSAKIVRDANSAPLSVSLSLCTKCHIAVANGLSDSCQHETVDVRVWESIPDDSLLGKHFYNQEVEGVLLARVSPISFLVQIGTRDLQRTLQFPTWLAMQDLKLVNSETMSTWTFVA